MLAIKSNANQICECAPHLRFFFFFYILVSCRLFTNYELRYCLFLLLIQMLSIENKIYFRVFLCVGSSFFFLLFFLLFYYFAGSSFFCLFVYLLFYYFAKEADKTADSEEPDQIPRSRLSLQQFLRNICPNIYHFSRTRSFLSSSTFRPCIILVFKYVFIQLSNDDTHTHNTDKTFTGLRLKQPPTQK